MAQGCERWRPVVGFEMRYEVSDLGNIRRVTASRGTFPGRSIARSATNGRPKVILYRQGYRRTAYLHLLVASAFLQTPPSGYTVGFLDGNPANLRVSNLCFRRKENSHGG